MEEFNEAMLKTKVDNIFVKLHLAIMNDDLKSVKHFLSDNLYEIFNNKINELNKLNERQMYDELNVKDTFILERIIDKDKDIVKVKLISRYLDYIIDKNTNKLIKGNNMKRAEKTNYLTLEKKLDVKNKDIIKKCPGCGASISVNTSGVCPYCDRVFDLVNYDYVLVKITTI